MTDSESPSPYLILRPKILLPHLQPEYILDQFPATVGRHPTNDIDLPYDSISRFHARLEMKDGELMVTDLRSSNGTFVNGQSRESEIVRDQDVLSFGGIEMDVTRRVDPELDQSMQDDSWTSVHFVANESEIVQSVVEADVDREASDISTIQKEITDSAHLRRASKRLVAFYRLQEILRSSGEEKDLLKRVLDLLFGVLPVDRGAILTRDSHDPNLFNPVVSKVKDSIGPKRGMGISKTILMRCLKEKVAILTRDASTDQRFESSDSIAAHEIRSAMCVPLISDHQVFGFIQLDAAQADTEFNEEDLAFLANLGVEVGLQIHNVRMQREKIMSERMAAIGQTITGLAHNIKNVLLLSQGGMELMEQRLGERNDEPLAETWDIVKRGMDRINTMVNDMLDYSRARELEKHPCQVNEKIREIRKTFSEEMDNRGIECDLDLDPECPEIMIDADGLDKALVNLLINAMEECVEGSGKILMRTNFDPDGNLLIEVTDNAGGIPPNVLPRIFFPFFTTKGSKGSGLGLAMTKKFVEDIGGRIEVETKEGVGTTFRISVFVDLKDVRLDTPASLPPSPDSDHGTSAPRIEDSNAP